MSAHWLCIGVLALAGCAAGLRSTEPSRPAAKQRPAWKRSCEEYAGAPVQIGYHDASGGAAVTYRTKGDVQRLRQRTAEVANLHRRGRLTAPTVHDLYHIPHTAYVREIEGGAELVLLPKRPDGQTLEELRRNVQQEVWIMQKRGCGKGQEAL
jgi:hypothetical protein